MNSKIEVSHLINVVCILTFERVKKELTQFTVNVFKEFFKSFYYLVKL